ncbi:hypothetical protein YN120080_15 [Staphylococcus phage vB_SauM_JDYN]|nr:hypothetical protein YN120080_15 [Staphylococcus phage vB_SauM_JDYN]
MKFHLNSNIVEGTPEELVEYLRLLEAGEEDAPMGYTFWYIDGTQSRTNNVLKATLDGDFEDSTGTIYTQQAVSGLIKPLGREDVREKFEKAEDYECLLRYYPTVDVFAWK